MVVVFDLDDTLYPESAFAWSALAAVGGHAEKTYGWAGFTDTLHRLHAAGRRGDLFQAAALESGRGELSAARVDDLLGVFRQHRPSTLPWHADALEAVRSLHGRHPLGLISDGFLPSQRHKAAALGLERWISEPIFTEELGRAHWKPSPRAFELTMSRHPGERFVYVADNPAKDFIAPRALGWRTIRVCRADGVYAATPDAPAGAPDMVLPDLAALPSLL
jgi:putative hydrolase of the HAD superfamily